MGKINRGISKTKKITAMRKLIKEYAGSHFSFMINYMDGGYEGYVDNNINKIIYKTSFGKQFMRKSYRNKSSYEAKKMLLETCEEIIEYVNNNIERGF